MTKTSNKYRSLSCDDITLLFDREVADLLTDEEQHSLSCHLEQCRSCSEFVKLASNFRSFSENLSESELNFAIHRAIKKAHEPPKKYQSRTFNWKTIAIAASVAAVMITGAIMLYSTQPWKAETSVAFQCIPSTPIESVKGVFLTYCKEDRTPIVKVNEAGEVKVLLQTGTAGFFVDPARPNKNNVTVETPQGTVAVKGTVFTVRVDQNNTWVEVFRGVVEIASNTKHFDAFKINTGYGADLASGRSYNLIDPQTESVLQALSLHMYKQDSLDLDQQGNLHNALSLSDTTRESLSDTQFDSEETAESEAQADLESQQKTAGAQKPVYESMFNLIQDAQSCLIDRNWNCAALRYREVLARYPQRPESMAVLISLAKVELRHLNAPKDALLHYRNYLRRAPNGPLAEEALFGVAEAYQRLKQSKEEKESLKRFINKFPESFLVKKARYRLSQLED